MSNIQKRPAELNKVTFRELPRDYVGNALLEIGQFLEAILALDGDKSTTRMENLLPMVKDYAIGLSVDEIKEAFRLYVRGQLPLEPRDNYLTSILFNKVINEYKIYIHRQKKKEELELNNEPMLLLNDQQADKVIDRELKRLSEMIQHTGGLTDESQTYFYIYDYLNEKGKFTPSKEEKIIAYNEAKTKIIEKYKSENLIASYRQVQNQKSEQEAMIINLAKRMLLEKYIKQLFKL